MTCEKRYLKELRSFTKGRVTFGDGVKGRIKGIGKLAGPSSPCLDDMLLVEGLTANLISISQLCEQGLKCSLQQLRMHHSQRSRSGD
jgi:hypothetical protein